MTYTQKFFNSANESNPEGELAVNVLVSNIIEIATAHANSLGIGNPSMAHLGAGWVLSRLTMEMSGYPRCNSSYTISTWVENWNRHFSTRAFSIEDEQGTVLGYARSIWMVLDMKKHENFGLSHLKLPEGIIPGKECPIAPQSKHTEILPYAGNGEESANPRVANIPDTRYTFKYNDIDFYRHVNTVRYVTLLLNQYSLDDFDRNRVGRLEMSFLHEGNYGMNVSVRRRLDPRTDTSEFSVVDESGGNPLIFAKISLQSR